VARAIETCQEADSSVGVIHGKTSVYRQIRHSGALRVIVAILAVRAQSTSIPDDTLTVPAITPEGAA